MLQLLANKYTEQIYCIFALPAPMSLVCLFVFWLTIILCLQGAELQKFKLV